MLSIGTVAAGNAAQREYHERQLAESRDDYYRESEGPPGTWIGTHAARLGLSGEVSVVQFRRLLDGQHPDTGETLGTSMGQRKTLAFDLAFSAPKSVSLLRMAADEPTSKTIDQAHDRAVRAALRYVEREGWKGRELRDGERVVTDGTGAVGVLYRHETTRNADPQLHSHAVLANLVDDGTGRTRAIQSQVLYWQAKTAGTVYQAVLRGELGQTLGLEFDQPVNGLADIKGFDRGLIGDFSTRRAEILRALERHGLSPTSKSAAERVALESRRAKDRGLDHRQWRAEVRTSLARSGLGPGQAAALVTPARAASPGERPDVTERLAGAPLKTLTDQRPTEDARAVRQAVMNVSAGYTYDEVDQALEGVFGDRRLVQVRDGDHPRWTTATHLALERQVLDAAARRTAETTAPRITASTFDPPTSTPDGHRLSKEQRDVLAELLTSGRGVEVVRARAGAGKTTVAGIARTAFERQGMRVVGVAPTLQALAELDDVGLETKETLARCAFSDGDFSRVMRTMDHRTVVIVDEAAMTSTKDIAPLLRRAEERGAKVIAIGDDVQLSAVGAGGWFRYLAENRDVPTLQLTEVHRQRNPIERDRLNQLHRGDAADWIRWADHHDRITIDPTVEQAYSTAVERFTQALDDSHDDLDQVVVMAPQNTHRHALNAQLRRVVAERGLVDRDRETTFGSLLVSPGDRLVATRTVSHSRTGERLVENGEQFEVLSVSSRRVDARATAGRRRGELVVLSRDILTARGDDRPVDHAYARTVHKAQGATVDRSVLFAPDPALLGRNFAYVGLTRTRDRADLVSVAPTHDVGLERLAKGMTERRDHEASLAIAQPTRLDPTRLAGMGDREIDEHRHALLTEARTTMAHLTRLDRDARRAWTTSGETRVTREQVALQGRLEDRIEERVEHLETHDPTGDRQARGLMERSVGRALGVDQNDHADVTRRLGNDPDSDVAAADDRQRQARNERAPVERYLVGLLDDLDVVHGVQIDRSMPTLDTRIVSEHERPAVALHAARERAERIRALTGAAAQQLGTGHPHVGEWLNRTTPQAGIGHPRPAAGPTTNWTPLQSVFADALTAWENSQSPWATNQGRADLRLIEAVEARWNAAVDAERELVRETQAHLDQEPRRVRPAAHALWERQLQDLRSRGGSAADEARDAAGHRAALEQKHGMPLTKVLDHARQATRRESEARTAARGAERELLRAGPSALAIGVATRALGRRDELAPDEQRRYDKLGGRLAVAEVAGRKGGAWKSPGGTALDGDVAAWNASRRGNRDDVAQKRESDERGRSGVEPAPDVGR